MKYKFFESKTISNKQATDIKQYLDKLGLQYTNIDSEIDYLFVFGGDGTFLSALKKYFNYDIKIILINNGKLGFLSSLENIEQFNINLFDYNEFNYLEIKLNNDLFNEIIINELIIKTNKLNEFNLKINQLNFKKILSNEICIVNSLGSTGINRSNIKPLIFPWSELIIIDVKNEPIYNYYTPLLQPIVLENKNNISFELNNKIELTLKIDNINHNFENISKINILSKKSKAKILNINNNEWLFKKINTLF